MKKILLSLIMCFVLIGCAATGDYSRSNVYKEHQVNQVQERRAVTVLAVSPIKIEIDNSNQRETWQTLGTVIGGVAGGLGAGYGLNSRGAGAIGAGTGAVLGNVAGSQVDDRVLVDGVVIEFRDEQTGRILSSAQVGSICEYMINSKTILITNNGETRVQPNGYCSTP